MTSQVTVLSTPMLDRLRENARERYVLGNYKQRGDIDALRNIVDSVIANSIIDLNVAQRLVSEMTEAGAGISVLEHEDMEAVMPCYETMVVQRGGNPDSRLFSGPSSLIELVQGVALSHVLGPLRREPEIVQMRRERQEID